MSSTTGLPHYTIVEFRDMVYQYRRDFWDTPTSMVLPWDKYLSLCNYVFSATQRANHIPKLGLLTVMGITVSAEYNGVLIGQKQLLEIWARHNPLATELQLGPYRYPVQNTVASAYSQLNGWGHPGWSQSPNQLFPPSTLPPPTNGTPEVVPAAEPECHCDSRKLATIGHEEHCAYIRWKRGRK